MSSHGFPRPDMFLANPGKTPVAWKQWIALFQNYMVATDHTELLAARKKAILLHCLGAEGQRLFYTLTEDAVVFDENDDVYFKAVKMLEEYFQPAVSVIAERYRFRQRSQLPGESIGENLAALRELITDCNFRDPYEMIRDQIVEKTSVNKIQEKLLMKSTLRLTKTLEIARQVEKALRDFSSLAVHTNTVNTMKSKRTNFKYKERPTTNKMKTRSCYRCGFKDHLPNNENCKAKNAKCRRCNKVGHFENVCKNTPLQHIDVASNQIFHTTNSSHYDNAIHVELCINSTVLSFLVYTGSPVTLLSRYLYRKYFSNLKLMKPRVTLTSHKINFIFHANLSYNGKLCNTIIHVVKEGLSLLGVHCIT
ncbi:uncharacterized protein LOC144432100 [Styela clava]